MTYDEWKSNPKHAEELGKLLDKPIFKLAAQVLTEMGPLSTVNLAPDALAGQLAPLYLGQIQGWQKYGEKLRALCETPVAPKQPTRTYGVEKQKTTT